ncbi:hypothetical protein [Hymenobacter latericus]|uniref:hypothetical protein n=1 Tax=Hymenobacter sp. YIM 151858-1 TaxID=2987688 RepID=UPI002226F032|nr:hypothetical protein [Hymenobacter sp. YIM 151858-1]UYZ61054.1 hypothetical protein OIS50_09660 [Hymenobacter sp. YIM 151858-1]
MSTAADFYAEYLDLQYRPDLRVLTVRWLRDVSFAELQAGFRAALHLGLAHRATHWLVDVRRRAELNASSSGWVAQHLLPEAAAGLRPAQLYVAYLLSPARVEAIQATAALAQTVAASQAATQPYTLQIFMDEGPAVQWLLGQG